jgi:hypothetical protein
MFYIRLHVAMNVHYCFRRGRGIAPHLQDTREADAEANSIRAEQSEQPISRA